jgi:hypothetical protein
MKFSVRVSPLMEKWSSPLGSIEDRLIRIPAGLRKGFGLSPGLFLCLKDKSGNPLSLQVSTAYKGDVENDDNSVYVSTATYNLLSVEKISGVEPAEDILIGCDPEFFLVEGASSRNISATHFFPHYGEVGSDCGLAELRPRPAFTEAGLSRNIRQLLTKAYSHLNNRVLFSDRSIKMVAASYRNDAAAGYHIHFGLPQFLLRITPETNSLLAQIVSVLDYYVGISAILPEGAEDFKRRSPRFGRYGRPGDHRYDLMTLEYRVPGGHLLRHPTLSSGLLAISLVVAKDILSRLNAYTDGFKRTSPFRSYNDLNFLYPNLPAREKVYNCIASETTGLALEQIDVILKDISSMIGYESNADTIVEYFDYILKYTHKAKKFSENIEINWRLGENEKQPRKMAVLQSSI